MGTIPSFELNRRWVWGRTVQPQLIRQAGPFTALLFLGLDLSTLTVSMVGRWADHAHLGATPRTLAIETANVAAFGLLRLKGLL